MLMSINKEYDPTRLIFSKLIDYIPQALFWKDNQGAFLGCNTRFCQLLGLEDKKKLVGLTDQELPQQYLEQVKIIARKVNRIPLLDERGVKQGILGIIDLNEVSVSEQAEVRQGSYDELKQILDTIPVPVFWKDRNGCYQGCNEALIQFLQIESETISGQRDQDLYWNQWANDWHQHDIEVMQNDACKSVEAMLVRPDQSCVHIVITKVPLRDPLGEIIGIVGSFTDVTQMRAQQAELVRARDQMVSLNEAKNQIFMNIGYDMRTPLHGVLGLSEVLKFRNKEAEHDELIAGVQQSGKAISYLVEDILSFAKQGATQIQLTPEPFDLRQLVMEVVDMHLPEINQKEIKVHVSYSETTPRYVMIDFHAVRRIVTNLLHNAIQFTKQGHIIVSVEPIEIKSNWAYLQIAVEDTGRGINATTLAKLSDHFNSASEEKIIPEVGVGLTVTRRLIRELGAKIAINSQEGKGATFQCSLPCPLQEMRASVVDQPQHHYLEMSVLMVDDNSVRGNILLDQLVAQEGHLSSSENAYQDLLLAAQIGQPYNVVIIDDEIQIQDYVLLAQQIQAQPEFNKTLLVLFSTQELTPERLQELKMAGYYLVLPKPAHSSEIIKQISAAWVTWQEEVASPQSKIQKKSPALLLVEDNVLAQFATQALLEDLGCKVEVATCGEQALSKFNQSFDVILMDVGLPDIDGITLAQELQKRDTVCKDVPVIALSAHLSEEQKQQCYDLGMKHVLTKPTTRDELQRTIEDVLAPPPPPSSPLFHYQTSQQVLEAVH